jgi:signal peptidase I
MIEFLKKAYSLIIDTMQTILLAASIFLIIYIFILRPFQVSGDSMYPTYKNKEYIITNLIGLRFNAPSRGDVIVFRAPVDNDKDFIKRIVGEPGDTILLKDGFVYVNGVKLDEHAYLASDVRTYGGKFMQDGVAIVVPPGDYLVMGDNRPYSSDSREWGFLKKSEVIGKSSFVYWPVNSMRPINNPFNTKK